MDEPHQESKRISKARRSSSAAAVAAAAAAALEDDSDALGDTDEDDDDDDDEGDETGAGEEDDDDDEADEEEPNDEEDPESVHLISLLSSISPSLLIKKKEDLVQIGFVFGPKSVMAWTNFLDVSSRYPPKVEYI